MPSHDAAIEGQILDLIEGSSGPVLVGEALASYEPGELGQLKVSVAGLGCGGFSRLALGTGRSEAEAVAVALVRQMHDLGVNLFDTAAAYGTESHRPGDQGHAAGERRDPTKAWVPPGESRSAADPAVKSAGAAAATSPHAPGSGPMMDDKRLRIAHTTDALPGLCVVDDGACRQIHARDLATALRSTGIYGGLLSCQ